MPKLKRHAVAPPRPQRVAVPTQTTTKTSKSDPKVITEIIKAIIVATEGGKYTVELNGKKIVKIDQTVPGYTSNIYFVPENYSRHMTMFEVYGDNSPINFSVKKISATEKTITLESVNGRKCLTEKYNKYDIGSLVLERVKSFTLRLKKTDTICPLRFTGTC